MTVSNIVKHKLSAVISAQEHDVYLTLAEKLAANNIGVLVILDPLGGLAGIVSERDLVRALARHGSAALVHAAKDMMTKDVITCTPHDTEISVMLQMLERHIRHMPVIADGKVIGMVSLGDAVRYRLAKIGKLMKDVESEHDGGKRLGMFTRHLAGASRAKTAR